MIGRVMHLHGKETCRVLRHKIFGRGTLKVALRCFPPTSYLARTSTWTVPLQTVRLSAPTSIVSTRHVSNHAIARSTRFHDAARWELAGATGRGTHFGGGAGSLMSVL